MGHTTCRASRACWEVQCSTRPSWSRFWQLQYGQVNVKRFGTGLMMAGWLWAVVLTPSSMYSWYFEQAAVWLLICERPTCAPHPLQAATDDWITASSSAALVQWPSPARHTAQTGFCGRKHSCKQLWQNVWPHCVVTGLSKISRHTGQTNSDTSLLPSETFFLCCAALNPPSIAISFLR